MIATWYAVVSLMLIIYVVLDGRNFGAGILQWRVARTREERRQVVAAIGPLWSWHEVWLVGFGGTLLAVFPRLMASAFAGYYLALFLILWALILRGISLEVAGHIDDPLWQAFWDFVFTFANILLAIIFGAAAGNLERGVPLDAEGNFSMAFFTNFSVRGYVGLLDWYTVSTALFAAVLLAAHGATYLALKTDGPVHDRSGLHARYLWAALVLLFPVIAVESWVVRPDLFERAICNPLCWVGLFIVIVSIITLISGLSVPPGNAGFCRVEWLHHRLNVQRSGRSLSGRALFDPRAGELTDRLRRRFQRERFADCLDLVAGRLRAGDCLFHLHLATLCRKGERSAGQPGLLLSKRQNRRCQCLFHPEIQIATLVVPSLSDRMIRTRYGSSSAASRRRAIPGTCL